MKLHINRSQAEKTSSGCFGSNTSTVFTVTAKLEASAEEEAAINNLGLKSKVLCDYKTRPTYEDYQKRREYTLVSIHVYDILNKELKVENTDLGLIASIDDGIKEGCKALKGYIEGAKGMSGSETIDL